MSVDYGVDVLALDDLSDPETLVPQDLNVAYAMARRLLTPAGAMEDIGDTAAYDSIDIRDWLGARFRLSERTAIDDLQQQATQVMKQDERVDSVSVLASYNQGRLSVGVKGVGKNGPFSFVLSVDGVTATLLRGT